MKVEGMVLQAQLGEPSRECIKGLQLQMRSICLVLARLLGRKILLSRKGGQPWLPLPMRPSEAGMISTP